MSRGRSLLVALVVLASGLLVSCGGGTTAVSIQTLRAAVRTTQAVSSERFTLEETVSSNGKHVTITGSGAVTADGKAVAVAMQIPGAGSIEIRLVDDTFFMNLDELPGVSGKLPDGKHWVRITSDEMQKLSGTSLQQLRDQAQDNSPSRSLAYLNGLSGDAENLGDEVVNGQRTTHYRASVDFGKAADDMPNLSDSMRQKLAKFGTVPVDLWVDDANRLVKMHFHMDGSAFSAPAGTTVDMTMTMTDFDAAVDVSAPPADDVADYADVVGQKSTSS